jgi:hypothetical protein
MLRDWKFSRPGLEPLQGSLGSEKDRILGGGNAPGIFKFLKGTIF